MHIFNKKFDLYTIFQYAHRMALRSIGMFVALFASNRVDAYTSIYWTTACPNCEGYGTAICDLSTATEYEDGQARGLIAEACIPADNKGQSYAQISDSNCVSKLQSIGMCDGNEGGSTISFLHQSGLSCVNGVTVTDYYTYFSGYTYQTTQYAYGVAEMQPLDDAPVPYICCNMTCGYSGSYTCCVSQSACLEPVMCGYCPDGYNSTLQVSSDSYDAGTATCTYEFQTYFADTQLSTGWCDPTTGDIFVEGTGALLISHFCYGTDYIPQYGDLIQSFCGFIVTGCVSEGGYYANKQLPGDPGLYGQSGYTSNDYCPACPDSTNAPWWCGIEYSIYSTGSGIESCYASPSPNPLSPLLDTTGSYELTFESDCSYSE